jgi:hypothetical protein
MLVAAKVAVIMDSPKDRDRGGGSPPRRPYRRCDYFEFVDIVPFGVENGQPVRFDGMFHPVALNLTMAEAKRSRITAFGIAYAGKLGLSTAEFSWAA